MTILHNYCSQIFVTFILLLCCSVQSFSLRTQVPWKQTLLLHDTDAVSIFNKVTTAATGVHTLRGGGNNNDFVNFASATEGATETTIMSKNWSTPLIPRQVLFGNPSYVSPILSPDGNWLAYIAPSTDGGILNAWVQPLGEDEMKPKQVTMDTLRGIRTIIWAEDSIHLLYLQDQGGDENFHLYRVNIPEVIASLIVDPESIRDMTPGDNVKVSSIFTNQHFPNEILVTTNQRNAAQFDVYRCYLNGDTADLEMVAQNPGNVVGWGTCDTDTSMFTVRIATVRNPSDSSNTLQVRTIQNGAISEWKDLVHFPFGEEGSFVDFIPNDGNSNDEYCYITSSLARETKALLKVNVNTGETIEEIAYNPTCDVRGVTLDRTTKAVKAVSFNYARTERIFYDDLFEKDYDYLQSNPPKQIHDNNFEINVVSRTRDELLWIVLYSQSNGPGVYTFYNPTDKDINPLFVSRAELLEYPLQPMEDVRIIARDGLELVGYLTRAVTSEESSTASGNPPPPLVLLVHGGPWARDVWSYNAQAQWLSNRGYCVLQVNYRGSTGYGKSFLHKGDLQWGIGTMQHDLTDSVKWAIQQDIADPKKICIYGGSYGGYACLAGLTFTPDLYACGVDIVGPSNVKTLLDSIPPYWGPLRNGMLLKIGNVDEDAEFNCQISPLFHIDKICAPLLIGHGANDPRVKQTEADQIAFLMDGKGIPVEYVLYPDEGHGFVRPDNRIDFNGRAEIFLSKHLGGRFEEFVMPEGSTATFPLLEQNDHP